MLSRSLSGAAAVRRIRGRLGDDRGASMIAALTATIVVLGFGALTLQLVQNDLRQAGARLDRDEPSLHAEFAASQGVARVFDGNEASFSGSGTVDGADYSFTVTNNNDGTWTVVGRSGVGNAERTATSVLRRSVTAEVVLPVERYAAYAASSIDVGWVRAGDVAGAVGSGDRVQFWYDHSIGSRQDYVSSCNGCPNAQINTSYEPIPLPVPASPQACPVNGAYELTGPVTLSGQYNCSAGGETLRISGDIDISGPVVIFVGNDTRLDIRSATINDGGDSADFVIAKPTSSAWSYRSTIDDSSMNGRVLAPETWMYVGDVTWRGTFEVETWWLFDWATIDGAWDGPSLVAGDEAVFGSSSYRLGTPDLSWTAAQAEAESVGGKLVEINSAEENAFILSTFGDGARSIPINISDVATEGSWVTTDGQPVPYENWLAGEPNNTGGIQHYARIAAYTGQWDDGVDSESAFIQSSSSGWIRTGSITVIEFEEPIVFGSSSYRLGTPNLSWTAARANAEALGGKLVEINSADENAFILSTFGDGVSSIPINISDVATEGSWVTTDGQPAPYENWLINEPNNSGGTQHYARIAAYNGQWDDGTDAENAFIQSSSSGWIRTGSITVVEFESAAVTTSTTTTWSLDAWQLD